MAKFLTLNTHSLLGENVEEKLKILGDEIFSGDYDVVCLQEVNQLMTSATTPQTQDESRESESASRRRLRTAE